MKEQEAVALLKKMGYSVAPPPSKEQMLKALHAAFDWYFDEVDDSRTLRAGYAAIKQLIEEHA